MPRVGKPQVRRGEHAFDPGHRLRLGRVDAGDPGVGHGGANEDRAERMLQGEVGDVGGGAPQQPGVFGPEDAGSQDGGAHRGGSVAFPGQQPKAVDGWTEPSRVVQYLDYSGGSASGRTNRMQVPWPGSLWASMVPPWACTRVLAMASPSPRPPESAVLTNRSNT